MIRDIPPLVAKPVRSKKTLLVAGIIFLLFAGGYYYQTRIAARHDVLSASQKKFDLSKLKQSPAPLTTKQKQQLADGTSTVTKEKKFYVTAGNFYLTPNKITVNQGDHVAIVITNRDGFHDFVIDALQVHSPIVRQGQFTAVRFTAEKKGTYEFYCSLPGYKEQGMKGTLVVQ